MASLFVLLLEIYLLLGVAFSIVFAIKGAEAIDEEVAQSPKTFRLLLIPGAILLWPVLLLKWMRS